MAQPQNKAPMSYADMEGQMAQLYKQSSSYTAVSLELRNAIASGEIQADQVNMGLQSGHLLQDPSLYPQLRQFAIQQGLAEEADLPMEYDEGMIFVFILGCRLH